MALCDTPPRRYPHSVFTGRMMLFLLPNQQCHSTEGRYFYITTVNLVILASPFFFIFKMQNDTKKDLYFQCFDTVGWVSGRDPACKNLGVGLLMVRIWLELCTSYSSSCHHHSAPIWLANPGLPGTMAVKRGETEWHKKTDKEYHYTIAPLSEQGQIHTNTSFLRPFPGKPESSGCPLK